MHKATKTTDLTGVPYAKLSKLHENQLIELDSGFTCHKAGFARVHLDRQGRAYFYCEDGRHHLDEQADDGEHCIGVYPVSGQE